MLSIRAEQFAALAAATRIRFIDSMLPHVARFHPGQFTKLGQSGTREAIGAAIDCAARYRITIERDVAIFIDLWFALGADFDASPSLPWAAATLNEQRLTPTARVGRLFEHTLQYLQLRDAEKAARGE
jgi:hypothetical protein